MTKKATADDIIKKLDELLNLLNKFDGDSQWIAQCICSQVVDSVTDNLYEFQGILNECILTYRDDWIQNLKEKGMEDYLEIQIKIMENFLETYKDIVYPHTPELVRIFENMAEIVDTTLYNISSEYKLIKTDLAKKFNEVIEATKYKLGQGWRALRIANGLEEPVSKVKPEEKMLS